MTVLGLQEAHTRLEEWHLLRAVCQPVCSAESMDCLFGLLGRPCIAATCTISERPAQHAPSSADT